MTQRTDEVATAAPSAPISGAPRLPKMKIQLSSTLRSTAPIMTSMPGIGRLRPSRKWVHTTHIISGGEPQAIIASTRPPPAAIFRFLPGRLQGPAPHQADEAHDHAEDGTVGEADAPVGAAGGTVVRTVGLGDEDHRALEQPDADQNHDHLRGVRRRVGGERLGPVVAQHRRIDRDHHQQAGACEDHGGREPGGPCQVALEGHGRAGRPRRRDDSFAHGAGP